MNNTNNDNSFLKSSGLSRLEIASFDGSNVVNGNKTDNNFAPEELKFDLIHDLLDMDSDQSYDQLNILLEKEPGFRIMWDLLKPFDAFTAVIEKEYTDRVYRDSYYTYYSGKHFEYSRYCKRVALFAKYYNNANIDENFFNLDEKELQKTFVGCITIRPIRHREIGRTLLNPFYFLPKNSQEYVRLAQYDVNVFGKSLSVKAFPYTMQDGETISCAETTLINLTDYYSRKYPEYSYLLPSDIQRINHQVVFERQVPTTGLTYQQMSRILSETGFAPRLYNAEQIGGDRTRRIMHYYIESGIPVAVGVQVPSRDYQRHSIICIGHGRIHSDPEDFQKYMTPVPVIAGSKDKDRILWLSNAADVIEDYCVIDDNQSPYQMVTAGREFSSGISEKDSAIWLKTGNEYQYKIDFLLVPLYKRMYLEAADAYSICATVLASRGYGISDALEKLYQLGIETSENLKIHDISEDRKFGSRSNPIVMRLFMASSRTFKHVRTRQFSERRATIMLALYSTLALPKFVWVCELYTSESYGQRRAFGEIIIDATASANVKTDSVIFINYPYQIMYRARDWFNQREGDTGKNEVMFSQGIAGWTWIPTFDGNLSAFNSAY